MTKLLISAIRRLTNAITALAIFARRHPRVIQAATASLVLIVIAAIVYGATAAISAIS